MQHFCHVHRRRAGAGRDRDRAGRLLDRGRRVGVVVVGRERSVAELVRQLEEAVAGPRPEPWSLDRPWSEHGAELAAALRELVR